MRCARCSCCSPTSSDGATERKIRGVRSVDASRSCGASARPQGAARRARARDHGVDRRQGLRGLRRLSDGRGARPVLRRICRDQPFHADGGPHHRTRRDHALAAAPRARGASYEHSATNSSPSPGASTLFACCAGSSARSRTSRASATRARCRGIRDPLAKSLYGISRLDARGGGRRRRRGRMRLVARFLGMFGPQGALPLTTTEEAYALAARARRRVPALRRYFPAAVSGAVLSRLGRSRGRSRRTTGPTRIASAPISAR